jgi:AcrR family transcriptional regulator
MLNTEQKQLKRKYIAKSTCDLFIERGYVNITVSEIAKVAGIGKGTVYEYFKNKEEIIFELMACLQEDYDPKLMEKLLLNTSTKQKVINLFDIYLSDDIVVQTQRKIYKEYLSVFICNKTEEMIHYNKKMMEKYSNILEEIFKTAIEKDEISEISLEMIPSIFATFDGFFISFSQTKVMYEYIDNLFLLLEHNKTKA